MLIREIGIGDLEAIFDVRVRTWHNANGAEEMAAMGITPASVEELMGQTHRGWLAEIKGGVAGFTMGNRASGEMWVIAVLPEFENQGIGRLLMAQVEGWLASEGCEELWLTTDSDENYRAVGFYRKLGWEDWKFEDGDRFMRKRVRKEGAMIDVDSFLAGLHDAGERHDLSEGEREKMRLNITPETGKFLDVLIRESRPQRILEIGTSNGYSTIWLARAAKAIGAHVTSVDLLESKTREAEKNLSAVGLREGVALVTRDAGCFLRELDSTSIDLLFLDSDRSRYVDWWSEICRVWAGGILVVDNATSHRDELRELLQLIRSNDGFDQIILPVGKGQLVVTRVVDEV